MTYIVTNQYDDPDNYVESEEGETLANFVRRLVKDEDFQASPFDVFRVVYGGAVTHHLNKRGGYAPCKCSVLTLARGDCECGSLRYVEP